MRLLGLTLVLATASEAARDETYYAPGMTNPNIDNPMYWKDAANVLEDLNSFRALYIKYHSCAESYYSQGCNNNGNDNDEEGPTWYMGYTLCTRPNVAYSLYGELKNNNDDVNGGCGRATYINSFFTTSGVETFISAVTSVGKTISSDSATSYCTSVGTADDDDGGGYGTHGERAYSYQGATSYGLGCHGRKFHQKTFEGAFCDSQSVSETTDRLKTFNSELFNLGCVQIYSSSNGGGGGNNQDHADENDALNLLYDSQACSIRDYPRACPDPYGKLTGYTRAIERHTGVIQSRTAKTIKDIFAWIFVSIGSILIALGMAAVYMRERRRIMAKRKQRRDRSTTKKFFRRPSRGKEPQGREPSHRREGRRSRGFLGSRSRSRSRSRSPWRKG